LFRTVHDSSRWPVARFDGTINFGIVSIEHRISTHFLLDDFTKVLCRDRRDVMRAHRTAALHKSEHGLFASAAVCALQAFVAMLVLLKAANIRFVGFNCLASTAKRSASLWEKLPHAFANAMGHKPCRAIGTKTQHAPKLMGADALLAGHHEVCGQ